MANSLLPDQIGFIPSGIGSTGSFQSSQLTFGLNITGGWQSIGFGPNGQPDILQNLTINISDNNANPQFTPIIISIKPADIISIILSNTNAPNDFYFSLKEVAVCEDSVEKRMVILASQTYLPS